MSSRDRDTYRLLPFHKVHVVDAIAPDVTRVDISEEPVSAERIIYTTNDTLTVLEQAIMIKWRALKEPVRVTRALFHAVHDRFDDHREWFVHERADIVMENRHRELLMNGCLVNVPALHYHGPVVHFHEKDAVTSDPSDDSRNNELTLSLIRIDQSMLHSITRLAEKNKERIIDRSKRRALRADELRRAAQNNRYRSRTTRESACETNKLTA